MNPHRPIERGCNLHKDVGFQADCEGCRKIKETDDRARALYQENQKAANALINRSNRKAEGKDVAIVAIILALAAAAMGILSHL